MINSNNKNSIDRSREHLANERTFLAWIRTSIALMGFGFVIVKFTLFLKQLSLLIEGSTLPSQGYSALVGVIMVAVGVVVALFAFIQYKINNKHLQDNYFAPRSVLSLLITFIMIVGGIILIIYLLTTI
ncbi:MAG: DUF202 domain-containing protein [Lentimicrobium sp.]|jgi:putative membrane protein|nr:DUF202 domain-containing protein [Lentimicrobium sp.]